MDVSRRPGEWSGPRQRGLVGFLCPIPAGVMRVGPMDACARWGARSRGARCILAACQQACSVLTEPLPHP